MSNYQIVTYFLVTNFTNLRSISYTNDIIKIMRFRGTEDFEDYQSDYKNVVSKI